jgi:hypothetical protein
MDLVRDRANKVILILIGQEVPRPVLPIHDPHLFVFLEKMGGPFPSRDVLLGGLERNGSRDPDIESTTTTLLQKPLDKSARSLAHMRRTEPLRELDVG